MSDTELVRDAKAALSEVDGSAMDVGLVADVLRTLARHNVDVDEFMGEGEWPDLVQDMVKVVESFHD